MQLNIITIHSIHNFGSIFQAVALEKFLNDHGFDARIIDYRPSYNLVGKNKIKTLLAKTLNLYSYYTKKRKFNNFIKNNMKLTKLCKDSNDLKQLFNNSPIDDIFISGGDQLWNPYHYCGNDPAYRLTFVDNRHKKIAFGTSLGKDNFTKKELNALTEDIKSYKFIGLRELSSIKILKDADINNVKHVCDPVLLLDKEYYNDILIKPKINEKYVLVYLTDKSQLLNKILNILKNNYHYKIIHVCGFRKKFDNDKMIKNEGPQEVLGLIKNADFIISASFHATLFSLLFEKQFISLLPNINTNARIIELLKYVNLENRIIKNESDLKNINDKINYNECNEKLSTLIEESKLSLLKALTE